MKQIFLYPLLVLVGLSFAYGQKSAYSLLYSLSAADALRLQMGKDSLQDQHFRNLLDTLWPGENPKAKGHFLIVDITGENRYVHLSSRHDFSARLIPDNRNLQVQVSDTLGQIVENASVLLDKKPLTYDPQQLFFVRNKCKEEGILYVCVGRDTAFYSLENQLTKTVFQQRLKRLEQTRSFQISSLPFRVPIALYHSIKQGIKHHYWTFPFFRTKPARGYIAINKPEFRPADTLKMTAHLTTNKGQPFRKTLRAEIQKDYKTVLAERTLHAETPGNYYFETLISDSFQLNKTYNLDLYQQRDKRKRKSLNTIGFQVNDDELPEAKLFLQATKPEFKGSDSIQLQVYAQNNSGQSLAGASISVVLLSGTPSRFYADEIWLPDTLWTHQQALADLDTTFILLPKAVFPAIRGSFKVAATIQTASGAQQNKSCHFVFDNNPDWLEFKLEQGWLQGHYFHQGKEDTCWALLRESGTNPAFERTDSVRLPMLRRVNPLAAAVQLSLDSTLIESIQFKDADAQVHLEYENAGDSLKLFFQNKHLLPVRFQVYREGHLVHEGHFSIPAYQWSQANPNPANYTIHWQYHFGFAHNKELTAPYLKKLLHLDVDHASIAVPNDTFGLRIKVLDHKGKPQKKVQLAAGGINSRFSSAPYHITSLGYRRPKKAIQFNEYRLHDLPYWQKKAGLTPNWIQRFGLDTMLFYQLRSPDSVLTTVYVPMPADSFYQQTAQLAPYVVKNGQEIPILLAYINRELVYYAGASIYSPYSFPGLEGNNTVVLRTKRYEYTLQNVVLKKGWKLELALDESLYEKSPRPSNIQRIAVDSIFSTKEFALLKNTIFEVKIPQKQLFIWQDSFRIHPVSSLANQHQFGPFRPSAKNHLHYFIPSDFKTEFPFEPGYLYKVEHNRERLYASNTFSQKPKMPRLPLLTHPPRQLPFHPRIMMPSEPPTARLILASWKTKKNESRGKFQYTVAPLPWRDSILKVVLIRADSTAIELNNSKQFRQLSTGKYELYVFHQNGNYIRKAFTQAPNGLFYLNLSRLPVTKDSFGLMFKQLYYKNPEAAPDWRSHFSDISTPFNWVRLKGQIRDYQSNEPLIFASVAVYKDDILLTGTETDIAGQYELLLPSGNIEIEVSYVGYQSKRIALWTTNDYQVVDIEMGEDMEYLMESVIVTAYKIPLISQDNTTAAIALRGKTSGLATSMPGQAELNLMRENLKNTPSLGLRQNFRDEAYFIPGIVTDKKGEARFTIQLPGDLTTWDSHVLAIGKRGKAGLHQSQFTTLKPLIAQLFTPRFFREGDRSLIIGQMTNYLGDTLELSSRFTIAGIPEEPNTLQLMDTQLEQKEIIVPDENHTDSLYLSYALEWETYQDGELRGIPIYPRGTSEKKGYFFIFEKDTSFQLRFEKNAGPIHLYAAGNMLEAMLDDIAWLKSYPYHCNEQIASRLVALLLEQSYKGNTENAKEILTLIGQLQRAQNADGTWGWWPGNHHMNWINLHVLKALLMAKSMGYNAPALESGLRQLNAQLPQLDPNSQLEALCLLADEGQPFDAQKMLADMPDSSLTDFQQLQKMYIQLHANASIEWDSFYQHRKTAFGESNYWGSTGKGFWEDDRVKQSLLAYKIIKKAGKLEELPPIRRFLLGQKDRLGRWRNTYETALILWTIFRDIPADAPQLEISNRIQVNGKAMPLPSSPLVLAADTLVSVAHTGTLPLFFSAWQETFQKKPEEVQGDLSIKTFYSDHTLTPGVWSTLNTSLRVNAACDYLMIEIPIPAGCTYAYQAAPKYPLESHREYFRDRLLIFCQHLEPGEHQFSVALLPKFSGSYQVNPAKVELMYFPTHFAREAMKQVIIK